MATRLGTVTDQNNNTFTAVWEGLTDADSDVGSAMDLSMYPVKTVQVVGDFTSSGAITIQGSNDGSTWATLRDNLGTALVITTTVPRLIGETTRYIRPALTAGTSVDMDVYIQASTDSSVLLPGYIASSLVTYQDKAIESPTAVITTGGTIFTVTGGPIRITDLASYCMSANGAGAQTLKWTADGAATNQTATDITAASGDLASFAAGGVVYANFTALNTALVITQTTGVYLYGPTTSTGGGVVIPAGTLLSTYTGGPSTGTWKHFMRYVPLSPNVVVS